jgi:DNA-binding NtrC family response regulator
VSDQTTTDVTRSERGTEEGESESFALVVVACVASPARVGEAILIDPAWGDALRFFGRGTVPGDGTSALLCRPRPGSNEPTGPLEDSFVSRKHLALGWHTDGVRVENHGRLGILAGGERVTRAVVRAGETLEIDRQVIFRCVRRAREMPPLRERHAVHAFGAADAFGFVGESEAAWELRERVAFAAERDGHVLLLGESGTGKELIAKALHLRSSRARKKLVARNAATLPAGLIDAELFGNAANYPNAGMPERPGLIGEADGSTLFLDEIAELSDGLQTHLLRVLDDGGEYQRLGDARHRQVDLRLVGATNRPVTELKHDLAARFRLRVYLPSLNARPEDVPLLARHLLKRAAARDPALGARFLEGWDGRDGEPRISIALARELVTRTWRTHVRELDAILWASLMSSKGNAAELTDEARRELSLPAGDPSPSTPPPRRSLSVPPRAELTAEAVRAAMAKHEGVKERVWRDLGLPSRFSLRRLLKKHGIEDDAKE